MFFRCMGAGRHRHQFPAHRFEMIGGERRTFFGETDQQRQVAEAVDLPARRPASARGAWRRLAFDDRPFAPGRAQPMSDVTRRLLLGKRPQQSISLPAFLPKTACRASVGRMAGWPDKSSVRAASALELRSSTATATSRTCGVVQQVRFVDHQNGVAPLFDIASRQESSRSGGRTDLDAATGRRVAPPSNSSATYASNSAVDICGNTKRTNGATSTSTMPRSMPITRVLPSPDAPANSARCAQSSTAEM